MSAATQRRTGTERILTVNEAAFAAGVSVKTVNQAIDRKQIRSRALRRATDGAGRGVGVGEAVYLSVSQVLAPEVRAEVYASFRGKTLSELPRRLILRVVAIDVETAIQEVERRIEQLQRIADRIEADPEVRGGEPVFRGTRTPVYTIARKVELGSTPEELREDYPHLREDDFELATWYASLHPRRGRPRKEWMRGSKGVDPAA